MDNSSIRACPHGGASLAAAQADALAAVLAFPLRRRECGQAPIMVAPIMVTVLSILMWLLLAVIVGSTRPAGTIATGMARATPQVAGTGRTVPHSQSFVGQDAASNENEPRTGPAPDPAPAEATPAKTVQPMAALHVSEVAVDQGVVRFRLRYLLQPCVGRSIELAYTCASENEYVGGEIAPPEGATLLRPFTASTRDRFRIPEFPLPLPDDGVRIALAVPTAEQARTLADRLSKNSGDNLLSGSPLVAVNLLGDRDQVSNAEVTVEKSPLFRLDVRLKNTAAEKPSTPQTRRYRLQRLLARNALPVLQLLVPGRPGNKATTDGDHNVVVTAPPEILSRVQTCLVVMDETDTIDPDADDLNDPRAELRRFFLVVAIENRGEAIANRISVGVLAQLRGVESPEWARYRKTGVVDPSWEASLRGDWPGKQRALQLFVDEWNRYPLLSLDRNVDQSSPGKSLLKAVFSGAPRESYTLRMTEQVDPDDSHAKTFRMDSLPPWWSADHADVIPSRKKVEP